jgi:hypothetical protein
VDPAPPQRATFTAADAPEDPHTAPPAATALGTPAHHPRTLSPVPDAPSGTRPADAAASAPALPGARPLTPHVTGPRAVDDLAEQLGEILRRQALEHGIDLQ